MKRRLRDGNVLGKCKIREVAVEGRYEKSGEEASDPSPTPSKPPELLQRPPV